MNITEITLTYYLSLEYVTEVVGTHATPIMETISMAFHNESRVALYGEREREREYDALLSVSMPSFFFQNS